jgi:hypothetical protein
MAIEVSIHLINNAWKIPYPHAVHSFERFSDMKVQAEVVKLAKEADYEKAEDSDVEEVLKSHAVPLSNDVLARLVKQTFEEESMDDFSH